jgi:hypothetical protein
MTPCSLLSCTRRSSETSGATQRTTRRHIQENDTLHNHHCENLKSYKYLRSLIINLTKQNPYWEGNIPSYTQGITSLLKKLNVHFRCHKNQSLGPILGFYGSIKLGNIFNEQHN